LVFSKKKAENGFDSDSDFISIKYLVVFYSSKSKGEEFIGRNSCMIKTKEILEATLTYKGSSTE